MKKNYVVYQHVTPDRMYYFGQTQNVERRWRNNGIQYKGTSLYPYIEKYGWENIQHIVLYENLSYDDSLKIEDSLIVSGWEKGNCINKIRSGNVSKEERYYQDRNQKYYEQNKDRIKQYQEEHKDEIKQYQREYQRDYREKNKEEYKEYQREYKEKNREKNREYQREYKEKNREKNREYQRQYRQKKKLEKQLKEVETTPLF